MVLKAVERARKMALRAGNSEAVSAFEQATVEIATPRPTMGMPGASMLLARLACTH
jgi:hypothetical protein